MKTEYLPTFIKELKALKSTPAYTNIKNLTFQDIPACKNLSDVSNIKKLKGEDNASRIRVGDYRIGFSIIGDTITFSRILH
jgi:mRNA-degrading endonuclease RelE of RelBE toxin-antitoxin system